MAETVGELAVKISADARGLSRDIAKQSTQAGDVAGRQMGGAMQGAMRKVALAVGGAAIGAAAVGGLKAAVGAASDLGESVNAVQKTFGDAAGGIQKLGREAATAVGLSATEFQSLSVGFAGFAKNIAGPGGDVVATIDEMTTRVADFASVQNLEVPEAGAIFQSALAGETEAVRKFGIDLSAAAVEQYALNAGIGDGSGELTEAQKQAARYGLLLQETDQWAGDFADTSDQLANSQRILSASWKDAQAELGAALLPAVTELVNSLRPLVNELMPPLKSLISSVTPLFGVLAQNLAPVVASLVEGLAPVIGTIVGGIGELVTAISPLLQSLGDALMPILEVVAVNFAALAGGLVTALVPALTVLVSALAPIIEQLVEALAPVLPVLVASLANGLAPVLVTVATAMAGVLQAVAPLVVQLITALLPSLPMLVELFLMLVNSVFIPLLPVMLQLVQALVPFVSELIDRLGPALEGLIAQLLEWDTQLKVIVISVGAVWAAVKLWSGMSAIYTGIITKINALSASKTVLAIKTGLNTAAFVAQKAVMLAISAATKAWTAAQWLLNAAMTANPIGIIIAIIVALVAAVVIAYQKSDTFRAIVQAAWDGIKRAAAVAWDFLKRVFDALKVAVSVVWTAIKTYFTFWINIYRKVWEGAQAMWRFIQEAFNKLKEAAAGLWRGIQDYFGRILTKVGEIRQGVADRISGLVEFVKGLPGRILRGLGNIGSLLFNAGADLIRGLWNGIQSLGGWIIDKLTGFVKNVIPGPIRKVLGISSPSKLFAEFGRDTMLGFMVGVDKEGPKVGPSVASWMPDRLDIPRASLVGELRNVEMSAVARTRTAVQVFLGNEKLDERQEWVARRVTEAEAKKADMTRLGVETWR